jgi:hypothetical protein
VENSPAEEAPAVSMKAATTDDTTQQQQSLWLANFAPVEASSSRKGSDSKVEGILFPSPLPPQKETRLSTTTSLSGTIPRKRCPSCSREAIPAQVDDEYAQIAYGQAMGYPDHAKSTVNLADDKVNPTVTFDDEDDSMWVHLSVQSGSPIKVKFDADTRLGDAKAIARLLAASISSKAPIQGDQSIDPLSSTVSSPPIHFLPNGRVGQMLKSTSTKDIFVQYPHDTTLLQARVIGDRLANAVESYSR